MSHKIVDYINENLSFRDEYSSIFGKSLPIKKCFCPFHENHDTPAAAMYDNSLYCFVCHRKFGVYDLLKRFNPSRIDEVKSSIIISDPTPQAHSSPISPRTIDRTLPIESIINSILQ